MTTIDMLPTAVAPAARGLPRRARRRSDAELVVRLLHGVRVEAGLHGTLQQIAQSLLSVFDARCVVIAARERSSGRVLTWNADTGSCVATPRRGPAPPIVVSFDFASEWMCRLAIIEPALDEPRGRAARLAGRIIDELKPAVYNVYQVHRLQTRAAAIERGHLARALHDGVIQSLIAAEMEVNAARLRLSGSDAATVAELLRIQKILRDEVFGVRDLMQRIKPMQVEPEELCDVLAEKVEKFKADSGIAAAFFADVRRVALTSAACGEIVRIVQEALSNIRKHSGARHAIVHLHEADGRWRLIIEDDGRGLDSGGDSQRLPLVIRECVRTLGGDLMVGRSAGGGLRLDITFTGAGRGDRH